MSEYDIVEDILDALAAADGIAPDELEQSLYEYVDTDALAQLAAMDNKGWRVTFDIETHRVTVDGRDGVLVDGTPAENH